MTVKKYTKEDQLQSVSAGLGIREPEPAWRGERERGREIAGQAGRQERGEGSSLSLSVEYIESIQLFIIIIIIIIVDMNCVTTLLCRPLAARVDNQ